MGIRFVKVPYEDFDKLGIYSEPLTLYLDEDGDTIYFVQNHALNKLSEDLMTLSVPMGLNCLGDLMMYKDSYGTVSLGCSFEDLRNQIENLEKSFREFKEGFEKIDSKSEEDLIYDTESRIREINEGKKKKRRKFSFDPNESVTFRVDGAEINGQALQGLLGVEMEF